MSKRVVITGLGAITALGEGAEALWRAALKNESGIETVRLEGDLEFTGGLVKDFDPEKLQILGNALQLKN